MDKKTAHEIWSYLNEKYGAPSDDHDDYKTKEEVHEDDEHIHDMVVVEDCSTSWSSDNNDNQSTTSSLDMIDDDDSSVANYDLLQTHLMIKLAHVRMILLRQAHLHLHIASCHKVTQRYQIAM